jgi:hypothetical protein
MANPIKTKLDPTPTPAANPIHPFRLDLARTLGIIQKANGLHSEKCLNTTRLNTYFHPPQKLGGLRVNMFEIFNAVEK